MMWRSLLERLLRTVPFLVALSAMSAPVSAQVVQGRLLDDATDWPVASVTIELLGGDEGDSTVATDVTDDQGHFVLQAPLLGTYRLRTSRIGYQPVTTQFFGILREEDPLEVEVRISAVAVPLEPLTIVSVRAARPASLHLEMAGYYERKKIYGPEGLGMGEFLGQEEIRRNNPYQVSDALRMVRGVQVKGAGGRRQTITLRGHGDLGRSDGRCIPQVYVDGAPVATGRDIDELLSPWSLAAAEVYPGINVPAEFARTPREITERGIKYLPPCGAIALWTGYSDPDSPIPETAPIVVDQTLVTKATQLALHLTIATDSLMLGDSLQATLTVSNLSDDARSLCVVDSRYTLRGSRTNRDIVEQADQGPCVHNIELAPRASHSWQDVVHTSRDRPGEVLIQKRLRLRYQPCGGDEECEVQLRSELHHFTLYPDDGE